MTNLSPATQAVITAIEKFDWEAGYFSREEIWFCSREVAAVALRAAADQVVPEQAEPVGDSHDEARHDQWMRIRYKLLAIADELEGQ